MESPKKTREKLKCPKCEKTIQVVKKERFDFHVVNCGKEKLQCNKCDKVFDTVTTLVKHQRLHVERFECEICKRSFNRLDSFKLHQSTHKDHFSRELEKIQCDLCAKTFHWKSSLRRHMESHGVKNLHVCECSQSFQNYGSFHRHKIKCTEYNAKEANKKSNSPRKIPYTGTFSCQMCSIVFADRELLEKHVDSCDILFPEENVNADHIGDSELTQETITKTIKSAEGKDFVNTQSNSGAETFNLNAENEGNSIHCSRAEALQTDGKGTDDEYTEMTDDEMQSNSQIQNILPIPVINKPVSKENTDSGLSTSNITKTNSPKKTSKQNTIKSIHETKVTNKVIIIARSKLNKSESKSMKMKENTLEIGTPKNSLSIESEGVRKSGRKRKLKTFDDYETDIKVYNTATPSYSEEEHSCEYDVEIKVQKENTSSTSKRAKVNAVKEPVKPLIKTKPPTLTKRASTSKSVKGEKVTKEKETLETCGQNEPQASAGDIPMMLLEAKFTPAQAVGKHLETSLKPDTVTASSAKSKKVKSTAKTKVPNIINTADAQTTPELDDTNDNATDDGDDDDDFADDALYDSDVDAEYEPEMSDSDASDSVIRSKKSEKLRTANKRKRGQRRRKRTRIKIEPGYAFNPSCEPTAVQFYCPFCEDHPGFSLYRDCEIHLTEEHPGCNVNIKQEDMDMSSKSNKYDPAMWVKDGEKSCFICDTHFLETEALRTHVNTYHASNQYCCGICRQSYSRLRRLERHLNTHVLDTIMDENQEENTIGNFMVKCTDPPCRNKKFRIGFTKIGLHRSSIHNNKDTFLCKACNRHFVCVRSLRAHISIIHSDLAFVELRLDGAVFVGDGTNQMFQCCRCTFMSKGVKEQKRHKCTPTRLRYYCPFCYVKENKTFGTFEDCEKHLTENHSEEINKSQLNVSVNGKLGNKTTDFDPARSIEDGETSCKMCEVTCLSTEKLRLHVNAAHAPLPFCCGMCRRTYGRLQTLTKHLYQHTLVYECSECVQCFPSEAELYEHISKHPTEKGVTCSVCMMKFYTKSALRQHKKDRHSDRLSGQQRGSLHSKSCICEVCGQVFPGSKILEKHMLTHSVENTKCNYCFEVISRENFKEHTCANLSKYSRDSYTKLEAPTDTIERKAFYAKFIIHESHSDSKQPFKCKLCQRAFRTRKFTTKHISRVHFTNDQKSFKCKFCDKGFVVSRALKLHMRSHTGSRPYRCRICSKTYRQQVHVTEHLKSHSRVNLNCRYCKLSFKTLKTLQKHVDIHCTVLPFKCYVRDCDIRCISPEKLKDHFTLCHDLKGVENLELHCNLCSLDFSHVDAAVEHLDAHLRQNHKLFQCETCPSTFGSFGHLYTHMDSMDHFKDPSLSTPMESLEGQEAESSESKKPARSRRFRIQPVDWDLEDLLTQYDYIADEDPDMFTPVQKAEIKPKVNCFSYEEVEESAGNSVSEAVNRSYTGKLSILAEYLSGHIGTSLESERPDEPISNTEVIEDQLADNVLDRVNTTENDASEESVAYIVEMLEDKGMVLIPTSLGISEVDLHVPLTQPNLTTTSESAAPVVDILESKLEQNVVNGASITEEIQPVTTVVETVPRNKRSRKVVDSLGNEVQLIDESGEHINLNELDNLDHYNLEGFSIVEVEEETYDEIIDEELTKLEDGTEGFNVVGEGGVVVEVGFEESLTPGPVAAMQEWTPAKGVDSNAVESLESEVANSIGTVQNVVEYGSGNAEAAALVEAEMMDDLAKDALHSVYRNQKRATLPFECSICGKRFRKVKYLNVHKKVHWKPDQHKHQCEICGKGFSKPSQMEIHMRTHTNEKPFKCKICEKAFRQIGHLDEHLKRHEKDFKYECQFCDYKAVRATLRKKHILRYHKQEMIDIAKTVGNVLECKQCGLEFLEANELTMHLLENHLDEKVQTDILMQFSNNNVDTKAAVENNKTKNKLPTVVKTEPKTGHICDVCGLVLGSIRSVQNHIVKHKIDSGELYGCKRCYNRYGTKTMEELEEHIAERHGNTDSFQCDTCGMFLENVSQLRRHMNVEHLRTKMQCSKCARSFIAKASFVAHIRKCFGQEFEGKIEESLVE